MSYPIYVTSQAIANSCKTEETENTKKNSGNWALAMDVGLSVLAATAFTLAILVAMGVDLPHLDFLNAVPLNISIGIVSAAGALILVDFAIFAVKKLTEKTPRTEPREIDPLDEEADELVSDEEKLVQKNADQKQQSNNQQTPPANQQSSSDSTPNHPLPGTPAHQTPGRQPFQPPRSPGPLKPLYQQNKQKPEGQPPLTSPQHQDTQIPQHLTDPPQVFLNSQVNLDLSSSMFPPPPDHLNTESPALPPMPVSQLNSDPLGQSGFALPPPPTLDTFGKIVLITQLEVSFTPHTLELSNQIGSEMVHPNKSGMIQLAMSALTDYFEDKSFSQIAKKQPGDTKEDLMKSVLASMPDYTLPYLTPKLLGWVQDLVDYMKTGDTNEIRQERALECISAVENFLLDAKETADKNKPGMTPEQIKALEKERLEEEERVLQDKLSKQSLEIHKAKTYQIFDITKMKKLDGHTKVRLGFVDKQQFTESFFDQIEIDTEWLAKKITEIDPKTLDKEKVDSIKAKGAKTLELIEILDVGMRQLKPQPNIPFNALF